MAKTALKPAVERSISEPDDASRPAATSPESIQSESTSMNQHVDRLKLLAGAASIEATMADQPGSDAELLRLGVKMQRMLDERKPLRAERERLWNLATAEWKTFGLSIDDNVDEWKAHLHRAGYIQAEDADSAVLDDIGAIQEKIRTIPVTTFAGLAVKFSVVRDVMNIGDVEPRGDQDWHIMIFNEFSDILDQLAEGAPSIRSTTTKMADPFNSASPITKLFQRWNGVQERLREFDPGLTKEEDNALTRKLSEKCAEIESLMLALPAQDARDVVAKFIAASGNGDFNVDDPSVLKEAAAVLSAPIFHADTEQMHPDAALLILGQELEKQWAEEERLLVLSQSSGAASTDGIAWQTAYDATLEIVDRIEAIQARTVEGLRVKARAVLWCNNGDVDEIDPGYENQNTRDKRMTKQILVSLLTN